MAVKSFAASMEICVQNLDGSIVAQWSLGAGGGIGLSNVDARLRATFGERYALRIESEIGEGTTAVMTVPNLRGEKGQPELIETA